MDTLSYKTLTPNAQSIKKEWVVVDATGQVLGRLCSQVAKILRGKNKPCYSPFVECGDNVIIINADKAVLTGKNGQTGFITPTPATPAASASSPPKC